MLHQIVFGRQARAGRAYAGEDVRLDLAADLLVQGQVHAISAPIALR